MNGMPTTSGSSVEGLPISPTVIREDMEISDSSMVQLGMPRSPTVIRPSEDSMAAAVGFISPDTYMVSGDSLAPSSGYVAPDYHGCTSPSASDATSPSRRILRPLVSSTYEGRWAELERNLEEAIVTTLKRRRHSQASSAASVSIAGGSPMASGANASAASLLSAETPGAMQSAWGSPTADKFEVAQSAWGSPTTNQFDGEYAEDRQCSRVTFADESRISRGEDESSLEARLEDAIAAWRRSESDLGLARRQMRVWEDGLRQVLENAPGWAAAQGSSQAAGMDANGEAEEPVPGAYAFLRQLIADTAAPAAPALPIEPQERQRRPSLPEDEEEAEALNHFMRRLRDLEAEAGQLRREAIELRSRNQELESELEWTRTQADMGGTDVSEPMAVPTLRDQEATVVSRSSVGSRHEGQRLARRLSTSPLRGASPPRGSASPPRGREGQKFEELLLRMQGATPQRQRPTTAQAAADVSASMLIPTSPSEWAGELTYSFSEAPTSPPVAPSVASGAVSPPRARPVRQSIGGRSSPVSGWRPVSTLGTAPIRRETISSPSMSFRTVPAASSPTLMKPVLSGGGSSSPGVPGTCLARRRLLAGSGASGRLRRSST